MRGLLAIEPLYHQIVAGKKTQTRRSGGLDAVNEKPDEWIFTKWDNEYKKPTGKQYAVFRTHDIHKRLHLYPRYKIGEVLYLKEPTALITTEANSEPHLAYRFDYTDSMLSRCVIKWGNKLFMKAEHGREFVRVTSIKCERLLDISDEDCIAEGIECVTAIKNAFKVYGSKQSDGILQQFTISPKESFISLYKFANKIKASAEIPNLWVFCYSFEYLPDYLIKKTL